MMIVYTHTLRMYTPENRRLPTCNSPHQDTPGQYGHRHRPGVPPSPQIQAGFISDAWVIGPHGPVAGLGVTRVAGG